RLPDREGERGHADHEHLRRAPGDRDDELRAVEAERRRGVEVAIDVVDQVEAPEPGDAMGEHVPDVERVVHEHEGERHLERGEAVPRYISAMMRGSPSIA